MFGDEPIPQQANSFKGEFANDILAGSNVHNSAVMNALAALPPAYATMGWNAVRGSRTILKGGFSRGISEGLLKHGEISRGRLANHNFFNPRTWGRLSSVENLHGGAKKAAILDEAGETIAAAKHHYTPFDLLGNWGNKGFEKLYKNSASFSTRMDALGVRHGTEETPVLQRGALSKFTAAGKVTNKGLAGRRGQKKFNKVLDYLEKTDEGLYNATKDVVGTDIAELGGKKAAGKQVGDILSMQGDARMTQLVGGYMRGGAGLADKTEEIALKAGGKEAFLKGAAMAAEHRGLGGFAPGEKVGLRGLKEGWRTAVEGRGSEVLRSKAGGETTELIERVAARETAARKAAAEVAAKVGEKVAVGAGEKVGAEVVAEGAESVLGKVGMKAGLKFAGSVGAEALAAAIPGLNAVLMAKTVYDFTSFALDSLKGGVDLAKDAVKSFKGTVDKPIFGMGYRDTEVAATSRARGVQVIQNSRLNGRSILGSEASMMAARYG